MTRRLLGALALVLVCVWTAAAIDGAWQGALQSPAGKMRLVLKVTKAANGYTGTLDSIDQAASIPADSITVQEGTVKMEFKRVRGSYEGKLSADGASIAGQWRQGNMPERELTFSRFDPAKAVPAAKGAPLTKEEREFLIAHMERTRSLFLESISGLSEGQWNFKAAPDRWSVAECAEHITLTEDFLFDYATKKVAAIPPAPERPALSAAELRAKDEKIIAGYVDRSRKANAPEPLQPKRVFTDAAAVKKAFNEKRDRNIAYARSTQDDLRNHSTVGGPFGTTDAYQYLLGMAAHTERHTLQINEVKASPGYPKN